MSSRPKPQPSTSSTNKRRSKSKTKNNRANNNSTPNGAVSASSSRRMPSATPSANDNSIFRVNFEVRGKVQGVHFRKYTQMKGTSLGIRGWCQNTDYNTVIGVMEGPRYKIEQMKQWLKSTGSPKSIISGAEFKETLCEQYTLTAGFTIVKEYMDDKARSGGGSAWSKNKI